MPNIKACIFDLDGVIVDTAKYHYLAWKRLANELGFDFTLEQNERLKGVSRMDSLEILLEIGSKELDEKTKYELAAKKNAWYVEYINKMDESEILLGVKEFLTSLKEANIKIALGSASKNAVAILRQINMIDYFDAIVDGTKVSKAKPDPEVFLLGARKLEVDPRECIVFEDAVSGVEAAKNANMFTIGVGSPEILDQADIVVSRLNEVSVEDLISLRSKAC